MAQPFEEWYKGMPPVTKAYMTGCLATTMACYLDLVSPLQLYLNFSAIIKDMEIWRLLTNFFFFDQFGLNFLFHMFFLVRHSRMLEEGSFRNRTADFFFMYFFMSSLLLGINFLFYTHSCFPKLIFMGPSLAFAVVYVFSRRNPHVNMSFLGLFNFTAPYLPWVIFGFGVLLGNNPYYDLLGIIVGHVYYTFEDVFPSTAGVRLLKTPGFLKALFDGPAIHPDIRPQFAAEAEH